MSPAEREELRRMQWMLRRNAERRAKGPEDPYEAARRMLLGLARGHVPDPQAFVDEVMPPRKPVKITKPKSFFLPIRDRKPMAFFLPRERPVTEN